jgi:predicted nuclease of restriction endonuclease-like (RecB) superfamily
MKIKKRPLIKRVTAQASAFARESEFREVVDLIRVARQRAWQAVNTSLVALYWEVGRYISQKLQKAIWGEGVVDQLARYISRRHSDLRGFERRNLFRMRQFYDAYKDHKAALQLIRQLGWSSNLLILSRCKSPEEREFYLRIAHREGWDKRETDRQLRGALFERAVLGRPKVSPAVTQLHPDAEAIFKDSYLVDFLDLPQAHSEQELQAAIIMPIGALTAWEAIFRDQDALPAEVERVLILGSAGSVGSLAPATESRISRHPCYSHSLHWPALNSSRDRPPSTGGACGRTRFPVKRMGVM